MILFRKIFVLSLIVSSCGSAVSDTLEKYANPSGTSKEHKGDKPTPNNSSPDLAGNVGNPNPTDCNAEWNYYVAQHPVGLNLDYELNQTGLKSRYREIVIESSSQGIKLVRMDLSSRAVSRSSKPPPMTIDRYGFYEDHVPECAGESYRGQVTKTPLQKKTVLAGTFSTTHLTREISRISASVGNPNVTEHRETWLADGLYKIAVFQQVTTLAGEDSSVTTRELVSINKMP